MSTLGYILVAWILLTILVCVFFALWVKRDAGTKRNLEQQVAYFKAQWAADFERYQLFKRKVIDLTVELENERNQEPIIKYVEDPTRVPR